MSAHDHGQVLEIHRADWPKICPMGRDPNASELAAFALSCGVQPTGNYTVEERQDVVLITFFPPTY